MKKHGIKSLKRLDWEIEVRKEEKYVEEQGIASMVMEDPIDSAIRKIPVCDFSAKSLSEPTYPTHQLKELISYVKTPYKESG